MYGKLGYRRYRVANWNYTCEVARGSPLLQAPLAAVLAGSGSLLSVGLIIWADEWVGLFSRRIRVISRVNAAGSSTNSFASASGLSRTMAMSISPPSLDYGWMAGLHLCEDCHCLVFTQSAFHSSRALCARVSVLWWGFESSCCP